MPQSGKPDELKDKGPKERPERDAEPDTLEGPGDRQESKAEEDARNDVTRRGER